LRYNVSRSPALQDAKPGGEEELHSKCSAGGNRCILRRNREAEREIPANILWRGRAEVNTQPYRVIG